MINNEKKELLNTIVPKAILRALTSSAKHSITRRVNNLDIIKIFDYPFKIGREARVQYEDGKVIILERHKLDGEEPNNDVYLLDNGEYLQISREHCTIKEIDGKLILKDRDSACGTMVNEIMLDIDNSHTLEDGDIITIGSEESEYKYKFVLLDVNFS